MAPLEALPVCLLVLVPLGNSVAPGLGFLGVWRVALLEALLACLLWVVTGRFVSYLLGVFLVCGLVVSDLCVVWTCGFACSLYGCRSVSDGLGDLFEFDRLGLSIVNCDFDCRLWRFARAARALRPGLPAG